MCLCAQIFVMVVMMLILRFFERQTMDGWMDRSVKHIKLFGGIRHFFCVWLLCNFVLVTRVACVLFVVFVLYVQSINLLCYTLYIKLHIHNKHETGDIFARA